MTRASGSVGRQTILVINPNSNVSVTEGLRHCLSAWDACDAIRIECRTLSDGPFGIETDEDIAAVEPMLSELIASRDDCAACVIACYSDPGLDECRRTAHKPVFGLQQSAVATAIARGGRFGVIALGEASIARHRAYLDRLGVLGYLAGERPLHLSVDQAANDPAAMQRITDCGDRLVREDGADILILGCAGLARHRKGVADALGVPVIDPVQAATALAVGAVLT